MHGVFVRQSALCKVLIRWLGLGLCRELRRKHRETRDTTCVAALVCRGRRTEDRGPGTQGGGPGTEGGGLMFRWPALCKVVRRTLCDDMVGKGKFYYAVHKGTKPGVYTSW